MLFLYQPILAIVFVLMTVPSKQSDLSVVTLTSACTTCMATPAKIAERICDGLKAYYKSQNEPYDQLFYKFCENQGYFDDDDLLQGELEEAVEDNSLIDFYRGDDENGTFPFDTVYESEYQKRQFIYDLIMKCRDWKDPYPPIFVMKDQKIVHGYIRIYCKLNINLIPLEIIHICYKYYHLIESFKTQMYNQSHYNYTLSNNDMTITRTGTKFARSGDVYGFITIPSLSGTIHQWIFRLSTTDEGYSILPAIAIGIGEAGEVEKGNEAAKSYSQWFRKSQRVIMKLDLRPTIKTLSYDGIPAPRGGGIKKTPFNVVVGPNITYSMHIFCQRCNDTVELVSYTLL